MWDTLRAITPLEQARDVRRLLDTYGLTQVQVAIMFGITPRYVNDLLTLLAAGSKILAVVEAGELSATNAIKMVRRRQKVAPTPNRVYERFLAEAL